LSELYLEWNDLETATQHLHTGEAMRNYASLPGYEFLWRVVPARMKEAEGDLEGALELLDEAARLYYRSPIPDVRPIPTMKMRVWIAIGRLQDALSWARARGLSADDELSYLREYDHSTLARVLIAQYASSGVERYVEEALDLLERLLDAAEEHSRLGSIIEISILQALARHAQSNIAAALVPLALAEPEGYVRNFVDEGPPMAALLEEAVKHDIVPNYVRQLLGAFGKGEDKPPSRLLAEPLTERELDVLRLLGTDLNGPEIARELMVSLNTMRTHTKNIYNKLGVNNRRAAVRRAEELDLL
jgi:LuxR family maltose regulon positive regulatory protein